MKSITIPLIQSSSLLVCSLFVSLPVVAQVMADGTTSTTVTNDGNNFTINDGERAGGNLFHSFSDFSVPTNGSAFFNNAVDIDNIFSRVTGGSISSIDGLIRANGSANLFLINPAGIIFGAGARLDIGGSFLGSTADSLLFPEGEFSAVDLDNPPLLTINAPIGLGIRDNPADITVRGTGNGVRLLDSEVIDTQDALRVDSDATIGLVGGNIFFEDATIKTAGGRIEIGSVAGGEVDLVEVANGFTFDYSGVETFRDISLLGTNSIDASGLGSGDIQVAGKNISINGISALEANTLGGETGGSINLFASGSIEISGTENDNNFVSAISSRVFPNGTADAGDINIETGNLSLGDRALITTSTSGQGNGGNITINARDFVSVESQEIRSEIASNVTSEAIGNAGNITITTPSLTLGDGVSINSGTSGQGNGGNITINARDSVSLESQGNITDISSAVVGSDAVGNGGDININTSLLTVTNRAFFDVSIFGGQGNAGNITINASEAVNFDRQDSDGGHGIFANVFPGDTGNAGNIEINTGSLTLNNGALFLVNNLGEGNGGNIIINARDTVFFDSQINTDFTRANAFIADVTSRGSGNAGSIEINTGSLTLDNEAELSANTTGPGKAGNIIINAIDNIFLNNGSNVDVTSRNFTGSEGDAGNIDINTGSLTLDNGAVLLANTRFTQTVKGGNINIDAIDDVSLNNSSAILVSGSEGGSINITAKNLTVLSDSILAAGIGIDSGFAEAQSGDIVINLTEDLVLDGLDGEGVTLIGNSNFGTGNAGNIDINARNITFRNGANVVSSNSGDGNLGKINLTATGDITFDGIKGSQRAGVNNFVTEQATGDLGEINITAQNLSLTNGAGITSLVAGETNSGDINISANNIVIDGEDPNTNILTAISSEVVGTGNSGDLVLTTDNITLTNGGNITTTNSGQGNAGDIDITANNISIDGQGSESGSFSGFFSLNAIGEGDGGDIKITTGSLSISNIGNVSSTSASQGDAGNITINALDTVSVMGDGIISAPVLSDAVGNGGNIEINTPNFFLDFSTVSADSLGQGNAGDIAITTEQLTLNNFSVISADISGEGDAGNINIKATNSLTLTGGSGGSIISASVRESATGNAGDTNIETQRLTLSEGSQISNITFGNGNAGNLTILATESIELRGIDSGRSGLLVSALETDGNGGDLQIFTQDLIIADGAIVTVSNFPSVEGLGEPGTGEPGNINIAANSIRLENEGRIDAATQSPTGEGANITLQVADDITLQGNSFISAQALQDANGGNITINAEFIIASLNQNNDIIASAQQGIGGNINITAEGVFGLEERSSTPPNETNDIDASSEFGLDGTVAINTPDTGTLQEAIETPTIVEPETLGANACSGGGKSGVSSFEITGKGGTAPIPTEPLTADALIIDGKYVTTDIKTDEELREEEKKNKSRSELVPSETDAENTEEEERKFVTVVEREKPFRLADVVPARGMIIKENGDVILTAYPTPNTTGRTPTNRANCHS